MYRHDRESLAPGVSVALMLVIQVWFDCRCVHTWIDDRCSERFTYHVDAR